MPRFAVASVGLSAIIFAVLIPTLELNSTHLTNPHWPSYARLHEVWQFLTNAEISLLALTAFLLESFRKTKVSRILQNHGV